MAQLDILDLSDETEAINGDFDVYYSGADNSENVRSFRDVEITITWQTVQVKRDDRLFLMLPRERFLRAEWRASA